MKRLLGNRRLPESPSVEPWKKQGSGLAPNRRGRTGPSEISSRRRRVQVALASRVGPQRQSSKLGIGWGRGESRLAAAKTLPLGVGRVHETGSDLCADDVRRLETLWALEQVKLDCLALV